MFQKSAFFATLTFLIISFGITSCDSKKETDGSINENEQIDSDKSRWDNKGVVDGIKDGIAVLIEEGDIDTNVIAVCSYCYAILPENRGTTCDSCGLDISNSGHRVLTPQNYTELYTTHCKSCDKVIAERAKACKFCMAIQ
ncbi:MAG: hypothetical protein GQ574_18750 [Crocinitomix sp.]|nr:hypothetical protein [Crocinitomix sp.]